MPLLLLLFALHTFLLMGTGTWSDLAMVGEEFGSTLYYAREAALVAGFVLYVLLAQWRKTRAPSPKSVDRAGVALSVLFAACTVGLQVSDAPAVHVSAVLAIAALVGVSGGMVSEHIALAAFRLACGPADEDGEFSGTRPDDPYRLLGVVIGGGGAIAVVLQYALQTGTSLGQGLLAACFVICFGAIMWLVGKLRPVVFGEQAGGGSRAGDLSSPKADEKGPRITTFVCLVVAATCLFSLFLFYETAMRSAGAVATFYEWHRLFLAVGYLVIGAAAYLGGRPAASVAVLVSALFAIVVSVQTALMEAGPATSILFYALLAAVLAWSALAFMSIAARAAQPAFVAATWRIVGELVTLAGILLQAVGIGELSLMTVLIATLVLLAVVVVAMVRGGFLTLSGSATDVMESPREVAAVSPEEQVQLLANECGLTERERDVLVALVLTEDKNQQIADGLGISRRQLQNHIAHIYEKTGTATRAGLVMRVNDGG